MTADQLEPRFRAALDSTPAPPGVDAGADLPARLARASRDVLGVAGASVSLLTDEPLRRLPLASSDPQAAFAEQLQFTTGEGPCLTAHRIGQPGFSDVPDMERRWPAFAELLLTRTRYRATASLPLREGGRRFGALDLYLHTEQELRGLDVFDTVVVAALVADHLTLAAGPEARRLTGPASPWFEDAAPSARLLVWQAVGMVAAIDSMDTEGALDRLRAYSWAHDRTTDEVSADLVARRLDPSAVLAADGPVPEDPIS